MTLNDILHQGEQAFIDAQCYFGHGTDNAWDEAVWLTFHILDLPLDSQRDVLERSLTAQQIAQIQRLFQRRIDEKQPAAYLTQQAWFCGLPFYVDQRVLVPRSPIAECIEQGFSPWVQSKGVQRILDLCTGSACIAIACAYALPQAQIDASDIDSDALAVARINVERHQAAVNLIQSDLFANIDQKPYDIIVSNPPYVDAEDMANLPIEYRAEPAELALAAGEDGLVLVDKLLANAYHYLSDNGILVVEVGNSAVALEEKYPHLAFVWLHFERGGEGVFLLRKQDLTCFV